MVKKRTRKDSKSLPPTQSAKTAPKPRVTVNFALGKCDESRKRLLRTFFTRLFAKKQSDVSGSKLKTDPLGRAEDKGSEI